MKKLLIAIGLLISVSSFTQSCKQAHEKGYFPHNGKNVIIDSGDRYWISPYEVDTKPEYHLDTIIPFKNDTLDLTDTHIRFIKVGNKVYEIKQDDSVSALDSVLYYRQMFIRYIDASNYYKNQMDKYKKILDSIDINSFSWTYNWKCYKNYIENFNYNIKKSDEYLYYKDFNVLSEIPGHPLTSKEKLILRLL